MAVIMTSDGNIYAGKIIAENRWDFIYKYLDCYSSDEQVALSNDISVVIEVIESSENPYEYIKLPEREREYSDIPFNNVSQYIADLRDINALYNLQEEIDAELYTKAKTNYLKTH